MNDMEKLCCTCKWYAEFEGVCTNGESEYCADFTYADNWCYEWEEKKMILSIDPGTTQTAYCLCTYDTLKPVSFGKADNETIMSDVLPEINDYAIECVAIEHMQGYGMAVGKEVFDTCIFIGRMLERIAHIQSNIKILPIYRKDEKLAICGNLKANDTIIRHTLIDMFAKHDLKNGKGTKQKPDWFYGFKADCWSAFAVAYTAKMRMENKI